MKIRMSPLVRALLALCAALLAQLARADQGAPPLSEHIYQELAGAKIAHWVVGASAFHVPGDEHVLRWSTVDRHREIDRLLVRQDARWALAASAGRDFGNGWRLMVHAGRLVDGGSKLHGQIRRFERSETRGLNLQSSGNGAVYGVSIEKVIGK